LIARYTRKYKSKPPNSYIVQGYASVQLVARAIRAAGGSTDGADLQKALEKFKKVPTIGGPMTYTPKIHIRHTPADMAIMQVKNGKPRFLTRFTPTSVPPIKF
jgi:ABC-type branched-subunit amino acid transport system substrate-binding protein